MQKIIGFAFIALGVFLEVTWLGICFGSVVIGILLLIFAPRILFFPFNFFLVISLVTINGLKVGKVTNIEFNKSADKKGDLIVSFLIEKDFQFSKNSVVKIYSPSPLGGSNLAIVPNYEGEEAVSGDV